MTGLTRFGCLVILTAVAGLMLAPGSASALTFCEYECGSSISVSVDGTAYGNQGTPASYTYRVYNSGSSGVSGIALADTSCSPISDPTGDNGDGILNPGETWTYSCSTTLTDPPGTVIQHDVTASGTDGESSVASEAFFFTTITDLSVT